MALPKSLSTDVVLISITSRIADSPYAVRQAELLNAQAQIDVDKLVEQLLAGNTNPGVGTRNLTNSFYELRGRNAGRVIVKQTSATEFDIVAKFQTHARGDKANSRLINKLMDDYDDLK